LPPPGGPGAASPFFDVERFRSEPRRLVVVQAATRPTLVLGSTQSPDVVSATAASAAGVAVERRRGGGGAVLLQPGDHLWFDTWIPRADPLWLMDVAVAAEWVGSWWSAALLECGVDGLRVHTGKSEPGSLGDLVCFAGHGPGEVFAGDRKLVGLSQWRGREGALFSSCVYERWEPAPLAALLGGDEGGGRASAGGGRGSLAHALRGVAVGVADVVPGWTGDMTALRDSLLTSFALLA
jgi:lipoate-protein ligase A